MQKAAYGGGAFAFVFMSAMAGTAFMITGGFFPSADTPSSAPLQRAAWLEPGYISDAPPLQDAPWTTYDEARPIQYADSAEARQIAYTASDAARSDFDNGLLEAYSEPMQIETEASPEVNSYSEPEVLEGEVVISPKDQFNSTEPARLEDEDDLFAEADGGGFPSF